MEFGWADTEVTTAAASENFADFLENMLRCWPSGPCSEHLRPYTDASVFVGRAESSSNDLLLALTKAGEAFDPSVLQTPAINASDVESIKRAARAPRSLLAQVMSAEQTYSAQYGYDEIPEFLVAEEPPTPIWPLFPLAQPLSFGFTSITCLSFQRESMGGEVPPLAGFAEAVDRAPEELLGKVVVLAVRAEREIDENRPDLSDLWQFRAPLDLIGAPLDGLQHATQTSIATLIADIEQERSRRIAGEQGLMHRELDLTRTRHALAANVIDADYHREQLQRTRERLKEVEDAYLDLNTCLNLLGESS